MRRGRSRRPRPRTVFLRRPTDRHASGARRRCTAGPWLAAAWLVLPLVAPVTGESQEVPATAAEPSAWTRPTSHHELMDFLTEMAEASERAEVRTIGRTGEGRPLPVVFLGAPPPVAPSVASASGKPTVLVLGSIHGDEPSGREGALQFIRSVVSGGERALLDAVNVIVVPSVNPDGSEADARGNAEGYDLNRDWVVAETPEIGAILDHVVIPYRPDVFLDVHNGGAFPYHLTFQATLEPAADPDLVAFTRGPVFDHVKAHLQSRGMSMYWYSGPSFDVEDERWYWRTTEPWPRKQHSYGGLQDMLTLLFEIPERHSREVGAEVARESILALVRFVADHGAEVRGVVAEARRRTLEQPPEEVSLELEATPYPGEEEFLVLPRAGEAADTTDRPGSAARLVTGENRTRYTPARMRPTPWGYLLEPGLDQAVELLRRHGIGVEELGEAVTVEVERFRVVEMTRQTEPYQRRLLLDVDVELDRGAVSLPPGAHLVRVRQSGGRLIPQLLEPDAVDSLLRWNLLDPLLPPADEAVRHLPVYRLTEPPEGLATRTP